jgi:hypothetical protein
MKEPTMKEIRVEVEGDRIKLKRNHAFTLYNDELITWTCNHVFAVHFPPGSPFAAENHGRTSTLIRTKATTPHLPYEYTVAVHDGIKVLILDPVLIDVPPEN